MGESPPGSYIGVRSPPRAPVAQWTERSRPKAGVGGSSPSGGATARTPPRQTAASTPIALARAVAHACPMEPSEEIRRVVERWTLATARGDAIPLERLSDHPGTLMIGTDPAEWWRGKAAHAIWARQIEQIGAFPVTATEIDAWEEGTVGWAGVKETVEWEGRSIESRATYVLHLERDEWKIVHVHWSFPRAKVDTLGRSVTVSLDELEETLQRQQPDLSASLGVDGTVTIVFTDVVDSTLLIARLGDSEWVELIRRHNRLIEEVAAAHGGRESEPAKRQRGNASTMGVSDYLAGWHAGDAIRRIDAGQVPGGPPARRRTMSHVRDRPTDRRCRMAQPVTMQIFSDYV